MKKFLIISSIGMILLGVGCSENGAIPDEVQLRIRNVGPFTITDVKVDPGDGEKFYGTIEANQESEYQTYDFVYRYASIRFEVESEEQALQPIDYVGERRFRTGKFTYEIHVEKDINDHISWSLTFIED